jgi:hypothetical protein
MFDTTEHHPGQTGFSFSYDWGIGNSNNSEASIGMWQHNNGAIVDIPYSQCTDATFPPSDWKTALLTQNSLGSCPDEQNYTLTSAGMGGTSKFVSFIYK